MVRPMQVLNLPQKNKQDFNAHPQAAMELLKNIPRLESASWIIGQQLKRDIPLPNQSSLVSPPPNCCTPQTF